MDLKRSGLKEDRKRAFLVIVMSPKRGACEMSKDFTDLLAEWAEGRGYPVYLCGAGSSIFRPRRHCSLPLSGKTVYRMVLPDFGVVEMPTYLRLDAEGVIESIWTGSVSQQARGKVVESIAIGKSLDLYTRVPASE